MGLTSAIEELIRILSSGVLGPDERLDIERRLIALILEGEARLIM